ncbi:NAD-dependent epimerase/dehydratase family protein [Flammeovirga aprica]|uniref:NAD-dependent epimerase/dehydratase family protein n=1 Tax=Flammeovirga aprica JL-4 TaxID=694437 RepID=A0A7X9RTQ0_9BACT|nr:NAD-dependent epimerase/dehydratase family protein [Flammeovirga aprica]NME67472.1 NAD-dependent epimerase/dehydratase family protein [Flammeovirga aprica JL-4]
MEKIRAIITGATGMVGKGVLLECLESNDVEKVLIIVRESTGINHPKLNEVIHKDFTDFTAIIPQMSGYNACYFCLGISSAGISNEKYHQITYDLTMHFAEIVLPINPDMTFCYVSGAGTSTEENSSLNWANVKGKTENAILKMPFEKSFMFRPAFIQPEKGTSSKVTFYKVIYMFISPLFPILDKLFPKNITTTSRLGKAMISVVKNGYNAIYLENDDINKAALK